MKTAGETGITRRDVLRQLALAVTAAGAGAFNVEAARVVHALAGEARAQAGGYSPAAFGAHEFRTITRLAELIVPADEGGGSAVDAGAPEFIDLLCSQNDALARIYADGLAWLDTTTRRAHGLSFVDASATLQREMLDGLVAAERGEASSADLRAGVGLLQLGAADDGGRLLHQPDRHRRRRLRGQPGAHRVRDPARGARFRRPQGGRAGALNAGTLPPASGAGGPPPSGKM